MPSSLFRNNDRITKKNGNRKQKNNVPLKNDREEKKILSQGLI